MERWHSLRSKPSDQENYIFFLAATKWILTMPCDKPESVTIRSFVRVFKEAIPKRSLLWELMKQKQWSRLRGLLR